MNTYIGIDIGTTHTKAIVVSDEGQVLFGTQQAYPILRPEPGFEEQDPDTILAAVVAVIRDAVARVDQPAQITNISFSAAMHSVIAVDAQGQRLTNAMIWADTRSREEARKIRASPAGNSIYQATGTPIHPMSPLCKLAWLRAHQPQIFAQAAKFVSIKEYVLYRLGGTYLADYSLASATGLFDAVGKSWCPEALEAAGIRAEQLGTPVPVFHVCHSLLPEYRLACGLPQDVPLVMGGSDGCMAQLGSGCTRSGDVTLTIGTSGAVRMTVPGFTPDRAQRLFHYVITEGLFITGGAINNGGIVLNWLSALFMDQETGADQYAAMLALAETAPPGADDLLFLPYLLGERAPVWDADARGMLSGLHMHHQKKHLVRAALEGVSFSLRTILRALEEVHGPVALIHASGGFIQSPFWLQLVANITGCPIRVRDIADASALGAVYCGMLASGRFGSLEEIAEFAGKGETYLPDQHLALFYEGRFAQFQKLYPAWEQNLR